MTIASSESAESLVESGLDYRSGDPVVVRIRRRGARVNLDDQGGAVSLAGRPPGWREAPERVVRAEGVNANRSGVVFVPTVLGRDLDALAQKIARTSRTAYLALLELDDA